MTVVAGFNRTKRPYFFIASDGSRVQFPAFSNGQGDLVGNQLREYRMYETARQIRAGVPLVNTVLPAITGTAQVGQVLTTTNGTWTGNPTITYARQWKADGVDIGGSTATTYTPVIGDIGKTITVTVTASNSELSASATSAATEEVIAA